MRLSAVARPLWAALLAVVVLGTTVVTAGPAQAGPGDPLYLSVTKTVSNATPEPGEPFTYTIRVSCSEASCINARLDDPLPAELAGYAIEEVSFTPSDSVIPRDITWIVDGVPGSSAPAAANNDTRLVVDFTGDVTAPTGTGLQNGQTFTVQLTMQVPDELPPGTTEIINTASTTAENSSDSSDSATITVTMPERIAVDVTKAWTPATQTFQVGRASAIALTATNTSNIPVDSIVVQEPQTAPDGATVLDASNPFTIKDFAGFDGFAMPAGADVVQVDAYVFQAGTWGWVEGIANIAPALPSGVAAADVGGLRFVFTGDEIAPGASAAVTLDVEQRATDREGAGLSAAIHAVTNVVEATASAAGHTPASDTATAPHTVNPATVLAATTKDITPGRIAAGASTAGRIVATNASDVDVVELRAADLGYFTADVTFGGFTAPPSWPAGTVSAAVTYYPLDGSPEVTLPFSDGATPAAPAQPISGFEVVFSAAAGTIEAGASSTIDFDIDTAESAIGTANSLNTTNTVVTTVEAANGLTDDASDDASLVLLRPAIDITLNKSILPSTTVTPGERVVTSLRTRLTTTSDYITADEIVVEDAYSGVGSFWDAFVLDSMAPTQVPANTSLTVEVQGADLSTWTQVGLFAASATPFLASLTRAELETALGSPAALTAATGIRFTFENATAAGFASDTTVTPYVVSRASATLRTGGPTVPVDDETVEFENSGFAGGSGETETGTPLTDSDLDVDPATVESGVGEGPAGIDKAWNQVTVPAQSGAQRSTRLTWSVAEGYETVTITDPVDASDPETTVFEAFNLVSIAPIAASGTPFSNGWYLKYDTVDAVELYRAGSWVPVTEPASGWINASGRFVGYTLTATESAEATGVRIVLSENAAARTAARQAGSAYDPYAPEVGTGVASPSTTREFSLTWQLRDKMRVSEDWVTDAVTYNTVDLGVVDNTVLLEATPLGGGSDATDTANDEILITNPGPGVTVDKAVNPSSLIYVPMEGTPALSYPTVRFAVEANNNSVSQASYVRVMDSPVCTDADPIADCESPATAAGALADPFTPGVDWLTTSGQGNPFDRFDLTGVTISASIPAEVDLGASTVWLLRYAAGSYSTTSHTAAEVNAMTPGQLSDVVGVSVTFQDTDPVADGGSISRGNRLWVSLDTRLRTHLRVSGEAQTVAANERLTVPNRAFAQSYDPVLSDGVAVGDVDEASARLTGGDINVAALKSISPAALTEPTRNNPVTVTLGANQGQAPVSSLPPAEVRLTDDASTSPDFWNQFSFTGLGDLTPPAGSDQVVVSVYGPFGPAGTMTWVSSAAHPIAGATVPVPPDQYEDVQGLRLAFSRADAGFFSSTMPAQQWSTSSTFTVQLRDTYRDSGEPVVLAGSVDNTVEVISDRLNGESSVVRAASAQIGLSPGTYAIEVNKLANDGNHTASAGESVPWDVTFRNAGTGYLTITELRDTLPAQLVYLGDTDPVYTTDASGLLPEPADMTQTGNELVFTWPDGDRTMAPGETFSVRIMLEVQPGLAAGDRATNEMTVTTAETLASCANIASGGSTTSAWATDPTTCGTTDYVTPSVGPNLFTVKGVRGSIEGASNPLNPEQECRASLEATGGSYFRAPCAANSVMGGDDAWVLRAQNAGTTGLDEMVIFDALPARGDTYLISGSSRGSMYRPQMLDDLNIVAPEGTDIQVEVTSSLNPCAGTWAGLEGQAACEQNGEVWVVAGPDDDWSQVTAFRISLDFGGTDAGLLAPGAFVDVTYSTTNVPATAADPSGASVDVPVADTYAWNQFGVKYLDTGATAYRKIAPARMGIHLMTGALQIDKVVAGVYADLAPSRFAVDVACTVEGAPLNMGAYARLDLTRADGFTALVEGLPVGSECVLTESDSGAASTVTFAGEGVTPITRVSASVPISAGTVTVTLTNSYDSELAFTGATGWTTLVLFALVLVAGGVVLVLRGRRRLG
ncbi:DUF11 domain-containing protein [Demequina sp. TTPB684]|uniref:DUF5979 domain-containing protein n=1 Tax=unclassified Demequina TaxID=2620311 RepID=UPI001CF25F0C|nr:MULTISPECIES: DUF5979 domain-containing protein [unclassified Demequina]MCB2412573.1 DUF11 domain-containing protein [Demequina sp. TTPB684]UPU87553.1 DUF11 domain-containing protein [Demequina sp. TMPB413]